MTDRLLSASTSLPGLVTRKAPKVSLHGDSIANQMGLFSNSAPTWWQQVYKPRNYKIVRDVYNLSQDFGSGTNEYGGNFGVSSTYSGALYTGANRTGTQLRACATTDMTDATRLARVTAYAADIMFIEVATNENVATYTTAYKDATILNVKDLIAANPNPNKQVVFCSVYPRGGPMYSHVKEYIDWARHMAREFAGYHYLDFASWCIADSDATNFAWLPNLSDEGLHPGPRASLKTWVELDALWDRLGVRRRQPRPVYQQDIYSATNEGGNLLGTRGSMAGSGTATSGTGFTGVKPASYNSGSNGPQASIGDTTNVLATWSVGTITDDRGVVHTAAICTLSNTGTPLTGNTTHSFKITSPVTPATLANRMFSSQIIMQHQNLVGVSNLTINVSADGGSGGTVQMGGPGSTGALFPTVATAETLYCLLPWEMNSVGVSAPTMTVTITMPAGALPTGTLALSSAGIWFSLPSAYD